jgi:polar amino acid transport system substrate-binding protein
VRRALGAASAVGALALALAGASPAAAPPTRVAGEVTVALSLPSPGLQAGSVQGTRVVFSKGLEPELARALAARLGVRTVRFVNEPLFSRLVARGPKSWDFAIAAVTITPERQRNVSFTAPYLTGDQGVLVREGLDPVPTSVAALRRLRLCSERATTGAQYVVTTIRPAKKPQLVKTPTLLFELLRSGRCDAAVYDAPILAAEQQAAPDRYGPMAGRIATGERYGIVVEKGSALLGPLNAAVRALVRDGTVAGLAKRWLANDPATLRALE